MCEPLDNRRMDTRADTHTYRSYTHTHTHTKRHTHDRNGEADKYIVLAHLHTCFHVIGSTSPHLITVCFCYFSLASSSGNWEFFPQSRQLCCWRKNPVFVENVPVAVGSITGGQRWHNLMSVLRCFIRGLQLHVHNTLSGEIGKRCRPDRFLECLCCFFPSVWFPFLSSYRLGPNLSVNSVIRRHRQSC